jgi:hypothetical protein
MRNRTEKNESRRKEEGDMKSISVWANRPRSGERVRTLQKTRQKRPLRALKTYGAVVRHFPAELREQFSSLLPSFHRGFFGMFNQAMHEAYVAASETLVAHRICSSDMSPGRDFPLFCSNTSSSRFKTFAAVASGELLLSSTIESNANVKLLDDHLMKRKTIKKS